MLGVGALGWAVLCRAVEVDFGRFEQLGRTRYGEAVGETLLAWKALLAHVGPMEETERLAPVNSFFNRRVRYATDAVVWKTNDYWATPLEMLGRGEADCEDFAIAKYISLRIAGVPNERMRMIYVRARAGAAAGADEAHMVLGYYPTPTDEPLILDSLIDDIRPASRRRDLTPVFSFNSEGLWIGGAGTPQADPTARLSRWRDLLERMRKEGLG